MINLVSTEDDTLSHTELSVCFLGTGAGQPNQLRGASGTVLRWNGGIYLFDAGEGVQLQAMTSRLTFSNIKKIFITHMHGDHVLGIPSLILKIQETAKARNKKTKVEVYGPVGLYNYIAASLSLCYVEIKHLTVEIYELHGGTRRWVHPGTYREFPEFRHRSLHRKSISPNQDGTWTIERANEILTPEDAAARSSKPSGFNVYAAQIHHVPQLQCFGYMVQEPHTQPRPINPNKTTELGVRPGNKYKHLKSGFSVMKDDGSGYVHAHEVTGLPHAPRKVVFLGDCSGVPLPMAELCRNADVLVHEATFLESDTGP